jgi:hypothetical protein
MTAEQARAASELQHARPRQIGQQPRKPGRYVALQARMRLVARRPRPEGIGDALRV